MEMNKKNLALIIGVLLVGIAGGVLINTYVIKKELNDNPQKVAQALIVGEEIGVTDASTLVLVNLVLLLGLVLVVGSLYKIVNDQYRRFVY
jgi:hypothetical protein